MIDAGEVFSARTMLVTLGEKLYRHFVQARALRDGVPGVLRAGVLVAFHFYVWAAFWHQSGGAANAEDDRLLRRVDLALSRAPDRGGHGLCRGAGARRGGQKGGRHA